MERKLIINGDDFGLSIGVSKAIIELLNKKIISSTSIMGNLKNGNFVEELINCNSNSLGIHFNLTTGSPISKTGKKYLVENGITFVKFHKLIEKILNKEIEKEIIEEEFQAQMDNLKKFGIDIIHADSHKHIHMFSFIRKIFLKICSKNGIKRIRYPLEIVDELFITQGITKQELWNLHEDDEENMLKKFIRVDSFSGSKYVGKVGRDSVDNIFQTLSDNSYELMVHPGIVDEELKNISSLIYEREDEYNNLKDGKFMGWVEKNFKLIGYSELL